jgi:hypothetical protein
MIRVITPRVSAACHRDRLAGAWITLGAIAIGACARSSSGPSRAVDVASPKPAAIASPSLALAAPDAGPPPRAPAAPSCARGAQAIRVVALPNGDHRLEVVAETMLACAAVFEAEKSYSNGPAWEALIEHLAASDPRAAGVHVESESDAAIAVGRARPVLEALRARLVAAASDDAELGRLIRAARAAGRGEGDL